MCRCRRGTAKEASPSKASTAAGHSLHGAGTRPLSELSRLTDKQMPRAPRLSRARVTLPSPRDGGRSLSPAVSAGQPHTHQCASSSFPPVLQQRPLENSRFRLSLAESSTEGNIFGQLGARRTLAPPGPGTQAAARPQRQKLLLESKWQISPAWAPGWSAGSTCPPGTQRSRFHFSGGQAAWPHRLAAAN